MSTHNQQKQFKELLNNLLGKIYLRPFITALRALRILEFGYGHFRSSLKWEAVDKNGSPIPWFTYPAIDYLKSLHLSQKRVFEYGSGNSTFFWAKRCKSVISVEDNKNWYNKVNKDPKSVNSKVHYASDKSSYVRSLYNQREKFDIVVIDGPYREECATEAVNKLSSTGFIILDNSERHPGVRQFLMQKGFIRVDFSGFGPINPYTWKTSLFLSEKFRPTFTNTS